MLVSAQRHGRRGWGSRLRDHIFNHRHEANIVNQKWVVSIHSKRQPLVTYFLQQDTPTPKSAAKWESTAQIQEPVGGGGISHSNWHSLFCLVFVFGTGSHVVRASLEHAAVLPLTSQIVRLQMCLSPPN